MSKIMSWMPAAPSGRDVGTRPLFVLTIHFTIVARVYILFYPCVLSGKYVLIYDSLLALTAPRGNPVLF